MKEIRDYLSEQDVKNTRSRSLSYNSIQHLLSNRRYIGEYTCQDIVVPEGIPAIVTQALFDQVQERLAKNKKPGPPQGRGRLLADHETVLRLLRSLPLRRAQHQPCGKSPPLLQVCLSGW